MFGIFRTIGKIYHIITLLILLVAIYAGMLLYTVSKTKIENVELNGVENITKEGFDLKGSVTIHNGGVVTIYVKNITYVVTKEKDNETLVEGSIPGQKIKSGENGTFSYDEHIAWTPGIALGVDIAKGKATNVVVAGNVTISHFGIYEHNIPYSSTFDLGSFVVGFITDHAGDIGNVVGTVVGGIKDIFDAIS